MNKTELTPREYDILPDLISGLRAKDATQRLGIASSTVKIHRRNILKKLGYSYAKDLRAAIAAGTLVVPERPAPQTAE